MSSQSDPLRLVAHDFFSILFLSLCFLLAVVVYVRVPVSICEVVSTVRLAQSLFVRLVWRKIMEVLSADQQRLDEVTAKL